MVLPLRAIACQILFTFISVAIEAGVLQQRLGLTRRTSTYYAAIANLICAFFGWIAFFYIVSIFQDTQLMQQLVSYIFTGRFTVDSEPIEIAIVVGAIGIFFIGWFVKSLSLYIFQKIWILPIENLSWYEQVDKAHSERLVRYHIKSAQDRAILVGHAMSHTTILFLLILTIFVF
ncbi:MAG: hypothetical protein J7641_17290 [Cyanobacteria bacterium SID2]|nr:hypothetical protein [Cyanobacteria bacterium SID2]MBP0002306.1 hypothetical protein [Cyanobacteria bacterium SBC]